MTILRSPSCEASRAAKIKAHDSRMVSCESPDMGLPTHKFRIPVSLKKFFLKMETVKFWGVKIPGYFERSACNFFPNKRIEKWLKTKL